MIRELVRKVMVYELKFNQKGLKLGEGCFEKERKGKSSPEEAAEHSGVEGLLNSRDKSRPVSYYRNASCLAVHSEECSQETREEETALSRMIRTGWRNTIYSAQVSPIAKWVGVGTCRSTFLSRWKEPEQPEVRDWPTAGVPKRHVSPGEERTLKMSLTTGEESLSSKGWENAVITLSCVIKSKAEQWTFSFFFFL